MMFFQIVVFVLSVLKLSSITYAKDLWKLQGTVSSMFATRGHRFHMEDSYLLIENVNGTGIYGIFDGHSDGFSSKFAADKLGDMIQTELMKCASNPNDCISTEKLNGEPTIDGMLKYFIGRIESLLKTLYADIQLDTGTTCLIAIAEKDRLTVANVGDSRGVMCDSSGKAIALSYDHKPDREDEAQRIKEAGGHIFFSGVWRVKGLAVSRSLGDFLKKGNGAIIIPTPDILTFDLNEHKPSFIILASDGLWDVMTNQYAVDFIGSSIDEPYFGAEKLVAEALRLKSKDNITVVIVKFINGQYVVRSAKGAVDSANGKVGSANDSK